MGSVTKKDKPIRAMLDVMGGQRSELGELIDKIPPKLFGKGKARLLRKLVLLAIAASSDADGKNGYPSLETIAHRCLVTHQAVSKAVLFLRKKKLLKVESKGHKSSQYGTTNLYEILWPEKKAKKQKAPEHMQIEVAGVSEAPATIARSTCNNLQEHLQQFEEAHANRSCDNRPLRPPFLPSIIERRENPNTPSLINLIKQDIPASQDGQGKTYSENGRQELAKQYLVWLMGVYLELSLSGKQKREIRDFILSSDFDLTVLKIATNKILGQLEISNSYSHADSKLVASLPEKAEAVRFELKQAERQKADIERLKAQIIAAPRIPVKEEPGIEDTLALLGQEAVAAAK